MILKAYFRFLISDSLSILTITLNASFLNLAVDLKFFKIFNIFGSSFGLLSSFSYLHAQIFNQLCCNACAAVYLFFTSFYINFLIKSLASFDTSFHSFPSNSNSPLITFTNISLLLLP